MAGDDAWWPVDPGATRRERDLLLAGGLLAARPHTSPVRGVIERSWRRCVADAVPVVPAELPFADVSQLQPRLRVAAAPVLDRVAAQLAEAHVAIVVSDETGRILMRRAQESRMRSALDRAGAVEGVDYSEAVIGTNGLGTVVAERKPIFEPFTGRMLGTLSLTCRAVEATPLMCAMTVDLGRQIEGNLTALLGERQRGLIQAYLLADRTERQPVIVVDERSAFANAAALTHLDAQTHALLWTHLREAALPVGTHRMGVPLPSGWRDAVVERIGGARPAYSVRLTGVPQEHGPRRRLAEPPLHPLPDVDEQLRTAVRLGERIAVDGGPGTGKLHVARAALARGGAEPVVVDLACGATAVDELAAHPPGRPLVVRHLQDLDAGAANRVRALVERVTAPVAFTVDLSGAAEHVQALVGRLATTVTLPALRERHEHVPQLVAGVLAALPGPAGRTTFSSAAMQVLMGAEWPGNVAELCRTVEQVARRHPGRPVAPADLPQRLHRRQRALTMMESAERAAIVAALRRCAGNRTRAARALGIGRTTLYRKMQEHHIAP